MIETLILPEIWMSSRHMDRGTATALAFFVESTALAFALVATHMHVRLMVRVEMLVTCNGGHRRLPFWTTENIYDIKICQMKTYFLRVYMKMYFMINLIAVLIYLYIT